MLKRILSFYGFYCAMTLFVALAAVGVGLFRPDFFTWSNLYFDALMILIAGSACWQLFLAPPQAINNKILLVTFGFFLLGFLLASHHLTAQSIWLDEESQVLHSHARAMVRESAYEQQPPTSYYLTALSIKVLGYTDEAVRTPSVLFFSLSVPLFFWLILLLTESLPISFFAAFCFLLNPWLIRYGQEGRPIACGIFFEILWLNMLFRTLKSADKKISFPQSIFLFSASLLFLCALGFQPVVLTFSLCCVSLAIAFFSGELRRKWLTVAALHFSALLFFVPVQVLMILVSTRYLDDSPVGMLWRILRSISWDDYLHMLFRHEQSLNLWRALLLASIFAFVWRRMKKESYAFVDQAFSLFLPTALLFCFLFRWVFFALVHWELYTRYYLTLLPLLLTSAALGIALLSSLVQKLWPKVQGKKIQWALACLAALLLLPSNIEFFPKLYCDTCSNLDRWNSDWRGIYKIFRQKGQPGDIAYFFLLNEPQDWEQRGFLGKIFYYNQDPRPVEVPSHWDLPQNIAVSDLVMRDVEAHRTPKQIFLAFSTNTFDQEEFLRFVREPSAEYFLLKNFVVMRLPLRASIEKTLQPLLAQYIASKTSDNRDYRILDLLLRMAARERSRAGCEHYLQLLSNLATTSKNELVDDLVRTSDAECKSKLNQQAFRK